MTDALSPRQWTLEGAREVLPDVRLRTEKAVSEVESLLARRDSEASNPSAAQEIESEIRRAVGDWVRAMEAIGLEVKGLWLVDFDCGTGCYCWRWPEPKLEYFHDRDAGFDGRIRIQ